MAESYSTEAEVWKPCPGCETRYEVSNDEDESKRKLGKQPADNKDRQHRGRPMQTGTKEDVFTLDEGQVILQWPENLSPESFEDFESWLQLVIRKVKRSVQESAKTEE